MIKTKDGVTRAEGTKSNLLTDFTGTAESLMRRAPITAAELIKAVKIAEATVAVVELIEKFGEEFEDEEFEDEEFDDEAKRITAILEEEEEPEAEDEPEEEKKPEGKGKLRVGKFEADDIDGMLEWLKGELENLEDELDD